jgi:hypothetical protein
MVWATAAGARLSYWQGTHASQLLLSYSYDVYVATTAIYVGTRRHCCSCYTGVAAVARLDSRCDRQMFLIHARTQCVVFCSMFLCCVCVLCLTITQLFQ